MKNTSSAVRSQEHNLADTRESQTTKNDIQAVLLMFGKLSDENKKLVISLVERLSQ